METRKVWVYVRICFAKVQTDCTWETLSVLSRKMHYNVSYKNDLAQDKTDFTSSLNVSVVGFILLSLLWASSVVSL
jgi:hypothetical protein